MKSAGTEVLIKSPNCGFCDFDTSTSGEAFQRESKVLKESIASANYANTCYDNLSRNNLFCSTYNVPEVCVSALPMKLIMLSKRFSSSKMLNCVLIFQDFQEQESNASCPFAKETCLFSPTSACEMDTGQMDSHEILGIDAERVTLRKVATCAPLDLAPYTEEVNQTLAKSFTDL